MVTSGSPGRITRERRTLQQMIEMYCRENHAAKELCAECSALLEYARKRLEGCPFQEGKTTCAQCPVHCYNPDMREKIKTIMRYSGPRMLWRHPVSAVQHMLDKRRKKPV